MNRVIELASRPRQRATREWAISWTRTDPNRRRAAMIPRAHASAVPSPRIAAGK
jgi:hypothetical protein